MMVMMMMQAFLNETCRVSVFLQHSFVSSVTDSRPLRELIAEAKAEVTEEIEEHKEEEEEEEAEPHRVSPESTQQKDCLLSADKT